MKKIVLIGILTVLCLALVVGVTFAYNTSEQEGIQVITMGEMKIAAIQTAIPEGKTAPEPFEGGYSIFPGKSYSWIFEVENRCDYDAWIRVSVEKVIMLAENVDGKPDPDLISLNLDFAKWEYKDGYFYYKEVLKPGEKTEPLSKGFTFDKSAGNMYQNSVAKLNAHAYAVQVKNNGSTVFEAAGWPESK